jgi:hypothetical protein
MRRGGVVKKDLFAIEGYEPSSSEWLRRERGVYLHLRDLYDSGVLTTWEMNAIDYMVMGFMEEIKREIPRSLRSVEEREKDASNNPAY